MLKLERVSKYYFSGSTIVQALRRINLELKIGEFVAITGESGSGKSTLLNVLSGLDTYEEGKIYFDGKDISHYTVEELEYYRKDYIGYVFQEYNIINSYTVYQNIELALTIQGFTKEQTHKRVMELIDQVGLRHVANQKASKLSGGEKQRTVIARTLAKDYQILVCDEPTGNLNEEASIGIFKLLREISKNRLVIVVTHDISLIQKYATRKIHLYDGEIMEDTPLANSPVDVSQEVTPKPTKTTFRGAMQIAFKNVFTVPKKSIFTLLSVFFMLAMVFFVYSAGVLETNAEYIAYNPYFSNPDSSRIVLVKDDMTKFTDEELLEIQGLDHVRGVYTNDLVFDSQFITKKFDDIELNFDFFYFEPLSVLSLDEDDLIRGRLPENGNEVVIGNAGIFNIGDTIELANSHLLIVSQSLYTCQFSYEVVGIVEEPEGLSENTYYMFLSNEGLDKISESSVYENSEIQIRIDGTEKYDMGTDTWITPEMDDTVNTANRTYMISFATWVDFDNSLDFGEILANDLMFFEICRDFKYKVEVPDDIEAGLCDALAFTQSHDVTFRAITKYENDKSFIDVKFTFYHYTDSNNSSVMYMSQETYDYYFSEDKYQVTVIVNDALDGIKTIAELQELGYKVFYPYLVMTSSEAASIVVHNLIVMMVVALIVFVIVFVGYFVLRNLIFSKQKDYLILRSIGTSKKTIKHILRGEITIIALISIVIIAILVFISEMYIRDIPNILRYFKWSDYLALFLLVLGIIEVMAYQFTKKVFKIGVIASLKGVEQ